MDASEDSYATDAGRSLQRIVIKLEESRPVAGDLSPAVWLARVTEQAAMVAVGVHLSRESLDADAVAELAEIERQHAQQTAGGKLLHLAAEAVAALAQTDPYLARLATRRAKDEIVKAIDSYVADLIEDDTETLHRRSPDEWFVVLIAALGAPAAAAGILDDEGREHPDPRVEGALTLPPGQDPTEAFCDGLLCAAIQATVAAEFLAFA